MLMYLPSLWHNTKQSPGPNSNGPWNAVGGRKPKYELHHLRPGFARDLITLLGLGGCAQLSNNPWYGPSSPLSPTRRFWSLKIPLSRQKEDEDKALTLSIIWIWFPGLYRLAWKPFEWKGLFPDRTSHPFTSLLLSFASVMKYNKFSSARHKDKSRIFFVFVF